MNPLTIRILFCESLKQTCISKSCNKLSLTVKQRKVRLYILPSLTRVFTVNILHSTQHFSKWTAKTRLAYILLPSDVCRPISRCEISCFFLLRVSLPSVICSPCVRSVFSSLLNRAFTKLQKKKYNKNWVDKTLYIFAAQIRKPRI